MKIPPIEIRTIAIFRALQLGDLLCSIPAIRVLRYAYPSAHISLIGLPGMKGLIERFPDYIDEFIAFPGYPGLPEQPYDPISFSHFLNAMKERKFDLILQMQGNGSIVNTMLASLGPKYLAGFCERLDQEEPLLLHYPRYGHEIYRHLALMRYLDIGSLIDDPAGQPDNTSMEFPIYPEDSLDFQRINIPLPGRYICLHPGSRGSWRQWPPAYFASIADYCIDSGFAIVITGTAAEEDLAQGIASMMKGEAIILAGKTTLGAMAVLLNDSHGLISNCTGVSHMAAALEKQSVIISMDGEPDRWGPLNKTLHRTIDWTKCQNYDIVLKEVASMCLR
jgi:ADP-heptose:LPS heptosyltransferase